MKSLSEFCPVNDFQYFCQRKTGNLKRMIGNLYFIVFFNLFELRKLIIRLDSWFLALGSFIWPYSSRDRTEVS